MHRLLIVGILLAAGCGSSTEPNEPSEPRAAWADYAGAWTLIPDTTSAHYGNCYNVGRNHGGIHVLLSEDAKFKVVSGEHDGGWGGKNYRARVSGSLTPPNGGDLRFQRPGGEGRFTATRVTPTRIDGEFRATDNSFAAPSLGRTPCAFLGALIRE